MNTQHNQLDESGKDKTPRTACGGTLEDPENFPSAIYRGEQIYFCTLACLRSFEQNPDPFMSGEIEHPIDDID